MAIPSRLWLLKRVEIFYQICRDFGKKLLYITTEENSEVPAAQIENAKDSSKLLICRVGETD